MASVNAISMPVDVASAISDVAERTGLNSDVVDAAVASARTSVPRLGVSGWLASGKDTVAEGVFERLGVRAVHLSFGAALKNELDHVLDMIRSTESGDEARCAVQAYLSATDHQVGVLFAALMPGEFGEARARLTGVDARSRTPEVRAALQKLGTDIRRAQDDLYWVNQGLAAAVVEMAAGRPLYFTDCRFANEAGGLRSIGIPVVRLDVSRETQSERLFSRDGLALDPAVAAHPSETGLDGWPEFDLVIDNNGTADDAVEAVIARFGW
jgi:hypothetical protein